MSDPIRICMAGYGPPTTTFSRGLQAIAEVLHDRLGALVQVEIIWDIMKRGCTPEDLFSLTDTGEITIAYLSTSGMTSRAPELTLVDLPFLFSDETSARAAMDGPLGAYLRDAIERAANLRILGFFENGFRHLSNRLRPVQGPDDLGGMRMRVMNSPVHHRTFELLGTTPQRMGLKAFRRCLENEEVDAQENPYANTVTYGVHRFHPYHTETKHFYVSRAIMVHRPTFDAWPAVVREALQDAVHGAVLLQRDLAVAEEASSRAALMATGCAIVVPDAKQIDLFRARVNPVFLSEMDADARALLRRLQ